MGVEQLRPGSLALWTILLVLAVPASASLSEPEWNRVLARFRHTAANVPEGYLLRAMEQIDSMVQWHSPDTDAAVKLNDLKGRKYDVIVYYEPPFVIISGGDAKPINGKPNDPGNADQTRTPGNGKLSGITIDVLSAIAEETGVQFRYFYPCTKKTYDEKKECSDAVMRSSTEAIKMLDSVTSAKKPDDYCHGGSTAYCGGNTNPPPAVCFPVSETQSEGRCFVAGALKQKEALTTTHYLSLPFMEKGFRMATKASPSSPSLWAFGDPLAGTVWLVLFGEILFAAFCLALAEGYSDNESLPRNPIGLLCDSFYWSFTLILGVADKQPVTDGGRTIVLGMLFLTMLMQAVYTGSLNTILMTVPMVKSVSGKSEFLKSSKPTLCLHSASTKQYFKQFMQPEAKKNGVEISSINGTDVKDCMWQVYVDNATATFFDEPIIKWRIANTFASRGHCGTEGGYCWDTQNRTTLKDVPWNKCDKDGQRLSQPKFPGSLTTTGTVFSLFGYVFAFPKKLGQDLASADGTKMGNSDYLAFNQAIQYIKEAGGFDAIEERFISGDPECAAAPAAVALTVENMTGLFIFTIIIAVLGMIVGVIERFIIVICSMCPCKCCGWEPPEPEEEGETADEEDVGQKEGEEKEGGGEEENKVEPGSEAAVDVDDVDLPEDLKSAKTSECLIELEVRLERIEEQLATLVSAYESAQNDKTHVAENGGYGDAQELASLNGYD